MRIIRVWSAFSVDNGKTVSCEVRDVERDVEPVMAFALDLHPMRRQYRAAYLPLHDDEDCGCRPGAPCRSDQMKALYWWDEAARRDAVVSWHACGPDIAGQRRPSIGKGYRGITASARAARDARRNGWTRIVSITGLGRWRDPETIDAAIDLMSGAP